MPGMWGNYAGFFRAANAHRMPIVVHLWTGKAYGPADADVFLTEILPAAPDIRFRSRIWRERDQAWTRPRRRRSL